MAIFKKTEKAIIRAMYGVKLIGKLRDQILISLLSSKVTGQGK